MLELSLQIGLIVVSISFLLSFYRLIIGPNKPDRILALDTLYVNSIAILILTEIYLGSSIYYEVALLIAGMGFIGTVALSKYLLRGDIME
ncbi:MAG TPA: K+/H+ antiporter subunit F [Campylobacterales bacterium]|nr:K+/H+ antiporter subunit F [Campylobacterales bacterium]